jgi:hypothetical protein
MSSDKELGKKLAQEQKYRINELTIEPIEGDESRATLVAKLGGSLVFKLEGSIEKVREGHQDFQKFEADAGGPAEGGPTQEAIENQRNAKIQHGVAKTPDGEEWQRNHPAGQTEREAKQAEKRRREAERNKG